MNVFILVGLIVLQKSLLVDENKKLRDKDFHDKMKKVICGENELCLSRAEVPQELPQVD